MSLSVIDISNTGQNRKGLREPRPTGGEGRRRRKEMKEGEAGGGVVGVGWEEGGKEGAGGVFTNCAIKPPEGRKEGRNEEGVHNIRRPYRNGEIYIYIYIYIVILYTLYI
jgi:hypothetical protein